MAEWQDQLSAKLHYTTPATDMLYNTTNGQAHKFTTILQLVVQQVHHAPTDKNSPHRNARTQHLDMSRCWDVANFRLLKLETRVNGSHLRR